MSRTKRYYNFPNRIKEFYHPWIQFCCGHCKCCKDQMKSKRRRLEYKYDTWMLLRMEQKLYKEYPDHKELRIAMQNTKRRFDRL
jgi:hypothetical protein